jgi:dual 3',5'-cyclic-AMP and -GMP phosphodiesterase 11
VERIIEISYKMLKAQRISVMILSKDKKKLVVAESKDALGLEISCSTGIGGYVASTGELLNIADAYNDPRFNPQIDLTSDFKTKSILCVPITIHHEIIGVLTALNKEADTATATATGLEIRRPEEEADSSSHDSDEQQANIIAFNSQDEKLIEYLATNAGIAIKKAQLYHQAVRAQRNSEAILSIVRARSSDGTVEDILKTTIDTIYSLLVPELVSVYLCDHLLQEAWICVSKDGLEGLTIPFGHGVAGTVATSGLTVRIDNVYDDQRFCRDVDQQTGFKTKSMLCMGVPGFASSLKPIAVIQLINKLNGRGFDEEDEEALAMLCEEVSVALRQKVLELSLLRHSIYVRHRPDALNNIRLEESLLKEYGSVAQRFKYSSSIRTRQLNRDATSSIRKCPQSISADLLLTSSSSTSYPLVDSYCTIEQNTLSPELCHWDLDPFLTRDSDLMSSVEQMFHDFNLITLFSIDVIKLRKMIMSAHSLYHQHNPFHNFKHGFSVTHVTYLILRSGAASCLTSLDILAALVSALCHDLDHPGNNNAYEVTTRSELALTHSGDSVLERHHSSMTLRLLNQPENNIFENLSNQDQRQIQALITDTIMATDMSVHFYHVEKLEISAKLPSPHFEITDANSRRILLGHIIHAADLSGQVMKLDLALKWGDKCIEEFVNQCNKEKELKIPVTPFMEGLEEEVKRMRLQHGFVGNIVLPLWTALAECFPSLSHTVAQGRSNYSYYTQRVAVLSAPSSSSSVDGTVAHKS